MRERPGTACGRRRLLCLAPLAAAALTLLLLWAPGAAAEGKGGTGRGTEGQLVHNPEENQSLESLFTLYQPYLSNIRAYEPMYFLVGTRPRKSKFQFSFQYRLLNAEGPLVQRHPWVNGFHLAYTQTSFWDLESDSKPFQDTSYKPELFFLSRNLTPRDQERLRVFLQGGLQHESNGRGGEFSRSTNVLYCKPTLIWLWLDDRTGLQVAPRFWLYAGNDESANPDLEDYRGYFDLEVKYGQAQSLVMETHLGLARAGGSLRVDLSYPLHRSVFRNFAVYAHAQYVNALAESLISYQERSEALRFGISLVR